MENGTAELNWTGQIPDSPSSSESHQNFGKLISHLNVYAIPVIIVVGLIGNTASFLVYICTPRMRRQSSSVYLGFLAAVDSCFLMCLFVVWLGWVGIHASFHINGWCHMILYTTYVCGFLSAWTVIAFTFERWVVVFMPLKRYELCTRRRAILTMTTISVLALAFYTFSIWTTRVTNVGDLQICAPMKRFFKVLEVLTSIDTLVGVIIPCVAIVVMNLGIGIKLCRYTRQAQSPTQVPTESLDDVFSNFSYSRDPFVEKAMIVHNGGGRVSTDTESHTSRHLVLSKSPRWRILTKRRQTQLKITRALLVVSTVFVVLNLPSYSFRVHALILSLRNETLEIPSSYVYWNELLQFLHYINFAANFFLYSASSRNFRYALKRLLRRAQMKLKKCTHKSSRQNIDHLSCPRDYT